jgi:hypothetical protein
LTVLHRTGRYASLVLALPIALVALFSSVGSISAAGPIKLGLKPVGVAGSNFKITMQPGETRGLAVSLNNYGADPVIARTFAANAYSLVNGGFGVRLDGEPISDTTTWLTYPAGDTELAAGTAIEREFSVAVPAATPPGEYLTGIVLQNAEATSNDTGQGGMVLKQIMRQVVAVSIDVPGTRTPALALGPVSHSIVANRSMIAVAVHNLGNVRLTPTGDFVLWDKTGLEVTRFAIAMDTVYAHTDTTAEVPFSTKLNPGAYTAELKLEDASGLSVTSRILPLIIPEPVVDATPLGVGEVPPLAQANQIPLAPVASMNPWMLVGIAFGAGLGLMLTAGGVGFVIYRRRRRRNS